MTPALPGISIVAITPAAPRERPTPITGSFASDQVTYAAAGHARQAVVGEEFSPGVLTVLWPYRSASTGLARETKNRALLRSCQGPEQHW
jgi:hypothetical protein